jgi:hypothetical protein
MSTQPATHSDQNPLPAIQQFVSILWPSFLTASAATILFFALFDPTEVGHLAGFPELTRTGGYTIGFFCFWLLTSITSATTCYFLRPTTRP